MMTSSMPIHPRTGLRAVFVSGRTGRVYWPILGGSEPGGDPGAGPAGDPGAGDTGHSWKPPATAEEYNDIIEKRLSRERAKYGNLTPEQFAAMQADADAHRALQDEMSSDLERATREATDAGYTAATISFIPRIVRAEFKAEAKGILTDDQLDALLEDVDLSRYADDDGEPDVAKIKAKIEKITPAGPSTHVPGRRTVVNPPRSLGQGDQPPVTPKPGEAGRAQAERRFGKKASV